MALTLHNLSSYKKKTSKRLGRGNASGKGTYSGKGLKGQRARSGGRAGLKRLGVKQYLSHIPKHRGFKSMYARFQAVQLSVLEKKFAEGSVITPKDMRKAGVIDSPKALVKVLADVEIKKKFTIYAHGFSKVASDSITKAGGIIFIIKHLEKPTNKAKK